MDEKKIQRINELYHKSKKQGLTEEEKKEQKELREEYLFSIKNNLRNMLNNIDIQEADGTITSLSTKDKTRKV